MRKIRHGFCLALVLLAVQAAAPADDLKVGDYGDPKRLRVEGPTTFTPKQIKSTLVGDMEVLLVAHPSKLLKEYVRTLRQRAAAGYRYHGFPDVQTDVTFDSFSKCLVLTVTEGPRCQAGEIIVSGTQDIPADRLAAELTAHYAPGDAIAKTFDQGESNPGLKWVDKDGEEVELKKPLWRKGEPAPLDQLSRDILRQRITDILADLGYFFADFSLSVEVEPDDNTAALVIDITREGPKAVLAEIEIEGNDANSDEEICKYLDLTPGAAYTREKSIQIQRRLWESGRFREWQLAPLRPAGEGDKLTLHLDVAENPFAPPLSEELSAEEQILLKLRERLVDLDHWEGDLVFTAPEEDRVFELIISPQKGVIVSSSSKEAVAGQVPSVYGAAVFSHETVSLYSLGRRKKLVLATNSRQVIGKLGLQFSGIPEQPLSIEFGLGLRGPQGKGSSSPFHFDLTMGPAVMVALAHAHDAQCQIEDGILKVVGKLSETLQVEAESGRLVKYTSWISDGTEPALCIAFRENAFERRRKEIEAASTDYLDASDAQHPISSTLGFLIEEDMLWQLVEENYGGDRYRELLLWLSKRNVFDSFDWPTHRKDDEKEDRFTLHADKAESDLFTRAFWGQMTLLGCNEGFPYGSWPWMLGRNVGRMILRNTKHSGGQAYMPNSRDMGPTCCLLTGTMFVTLHSRAAHACADRGLQMLSVEEFRKDYEPFLDPNCGAGKLVARLAEGLRDLDEKELELLASILPDKSAECLKECVEHLRQQPDTPVADVLPELLDKLWQAGLREQVEQALQSLHDRNTADDFAAPPAIPEQPQT